MAIKQLGKQPQQFVKLSPIPFCVALAVALFVMMVLWRFHPDVFGDVGKNLHGLVLYAPLIIGGIILAGIILIWVGVLVRSYDQGKAPKGVQNHYKGTLWCIFVLMVMQMTVLFWVYFNGVAYVQDVVGKVPFDTITNLLEFERFPVIITGEIVLGFWVFKQFQIMLEDEMYRHSLHLLMALCVLAVVLFTQFLYLGDVQSMITSGGLLGDVMAISMFIYTLLTGVIVITNVFCLCRMALGYYQSGDNFSMTLLKEMWWGLCLLWIASMIIMIVWRPILV